MTNYHFLEEYARIQQLVEMGQARDEQLDTLLKHRLNTGQPLNLHDSRRRLKNLHRNLIRKDRHRLALLKRNATCIGPQPVEQPLTAVVRRETSNAVRRIAGNDWDYHAATIDGDYSDLAMKSNVAVGTIKSRVSRAREKLRPVLQGLA